jgi:hypothetical protein
VPTIRLSPLRVRYGKRVDINEAFLSLEWALIAGSRCGKT